MEGDWNYSPSISVTLHLAICHTTVLRHVVREEGGGSKRPQALPGLKIRQAIQGTIAADGRANSRVCCVIRVVVQGEQTRAPTHLGVVPRALHIARAARRVRGLRQYLAGRHERVPDVAL